MTHKKNKVVYLMPKLKEKWNLTNFEESSIASIVFVGMMLGNFFLHYLFFFSFYIISFLFLFYSGCWIFGYLSDKIGRKKAAFLAVTSVVLGGWFSVIAPNLLTMIICRGFVGVIISINY